MSERVVSPFYAARRVSFSLMQNTLAGLLIGLLTALSAISFALIIYGGPLSTFLPIGIRLALGGAAVVMFVAAIKPDYVGVLWQPQSIALIVLAKAVAGLSVTLSGENPNMLFASVLVLLMMTTLLSGVVMIIIGLRRLGNLARSIPYPVIGGLYAAIGTLLIYNSIHLAATAKTPSPTWAEPLGMWLLPVFLARLCTFLVKSRSRRRLHLR